LIDVHHKDIVLRTFILFVQSAHTVLKYADAHFYRQTGLSVIKFIVLEGLAFNGGSMILSEIAEWTYRERNNITTLISRLKKSGLVKTARKKADKRLVSVLLTETGREALNKAMPVAREIIDQVMSTISEDDAALLEKRLRVLRYNAHHGLRDIVERSQPKLDQS